MRSLSVNITKETIQEDLEKVRGIDPNLLFLFFTSNLDASRAVLDEVNGAFSGAAIVGCSTAGEIQDVEMRDNSVALLALNMEKTEVKKVSSPIMDGADSLEAAKKAGEALKADNLKAVFVLSPGLQVNGSDVVQGLEKTVGSNVTIFGGLAGDGTAFEKTYTLNGDKLTDNEIVAVGFYGDYFVVKTGSEGGWAPFGPGRRVTKSEKNVLFELDGKPALELYETYLGDKAAELPGSGLLYPFAILNEDHSQSGMIRTILDIDRENKSLILAGDLEEGKMVCLMHADTDELVDGAENAAKEAEGDAVSDHAAILVSCVGRKLVLADDVPEEIEVVKETLGDSVAMAGFYSYGEICPVLKTSKTELHNQTMTIAHFFEK